MTRAARLIALVLLIPAAAALLGHDGRVGKGRAVHQPPGALSSAAPTPRATPTVTAATDAQVRAQDRLTARQQRHETVGLQRRRLLEHLPIELAAVRIDIAGISADGQRTALLLHARGHSRHFARMVYRQALRTYGDSGHAYALRWAR
jgi:hypothetical protein